MKLQIKELTTIDEMLDQIATMRFLYPNLSIEKYESYLSEMVPHNYIQIAVFAAHRFYYNQGYGPKGFHFVKILDEKKLTQ